MGLLKIFFNACPSECVKFVRSKNEFITSDNSRREASSQLDMLYGTWWRNGSASASRAEGCVFKSRPGQVFCFFVGVVLYDISDGVSDNLGDMERYSYLSNKA